MLFTYVFVHNTSDDVRIIITTSIENALGILEKSTPSHYNSYTLWATFGCVDGASIKIST